MKAVILENRDGYSAVLREDGAIEKLKMQGEVGDTIIIEPNRRKRTAQFYRYAQVAAAAAVFLVAAGSARHYVFATSSYVTMDVNPSVEFAMNRMERVIDVAAVNEDAEEIVSSLKEGRIWGRTLADVIGETTQILEEYEYLSGSDDTVLFAVATDSDEEYAKIEASVLEAEGSANGLTVEVIRGGREDHDRAGELSLSVGRYLKMMEGISENNDANATPDSSSKPGPDDETVKEYRQMSVEDMLGKGNPEGSQDTQSAQMDGQSGKPAEAGADGNAGQEPGNGVSGGTAGNAGGGQAGAGAKDGGAQSGVGASDGGAQSGAQNGVDAANQAGAQRP